MNHNSGMEDLILFYIAGTLSPEEKRAVENWLRENPQAVDQVNAWKMVRSALKSQPLITPREGTFKAINQRVYSLKRDSSNSNPAWIGQLFGMAMAFMILVALWLSVKPGVVLEWNVRSGSPALFRIYRSPVGTDNFKLVEEIHATQDKRTYNYVDAWLLPGTEYSYRVEGIGQDNQLSMSEVMKVSTDGVLSGQLAILLVSALMGYAVIRLLEYFPGGFSRTEASQFF